MSNEILLKIINLKKYFPVQRKFLGKPLFIKAVDGVSLEVFKGETLGIVGESGCGKSTLALLIPRLIEPTDGKILIDNIDITGLNRKQLKEIRRNIGIVFQDPYSSLNPRMNIYQTLSRPLLIHGIKDREEIRRRIIEILSLVGLSEEFIYRYPHQLSGGQQQRVSIARAIILNPKLTIYDEPTSSLDVSVQAQILNLILDLQTKLNLTYIFISHDLLTVRHVSDRVAVMYLGKIVEIGGADDIFLRPRHPYTASLLTALPLPDPKLKDISRLKIRGEVPSAINPPRGCRFHTRCPYAIDICKIEDPTPTNVNDQHYVACHRYDEIDLQERIRDFWRGLRNI